MPSAEEIRFALERIANDWRLLAVAWHLLLALFVASLALGARPSKRVAGLLLATPLLSAGALAWAHANPFNGAALSATAIGLVVVALRLPAAPIHLARPWAIAIGAIMFAFGWVYPHFLETSSFLPYLVASPVGLIPCPTLAVVLGLSIILGGFGALAWAFLLATAGAFYGLFGALHLGVSLDWGLLFGAAAVVPITLSDRAAGEGPHRGHP